MLNFAQTEFYEVASGDPMVRSFPENTSPYEAPHARVSAPTTAEVPVISLSTELKAELDERTDSVLPWPWSTQALMRAIERAVHAPDGEP